MTLCVAALGVDGNRTKVVLAADYAVETEIATAEIQNKFMYVGDREYPVLIAGSSSRATELLARIADCGNTAKYKITEEAQFMRLCREAMRRQKHVIADEYVCARLGISYDTLLESVHKSIPPETYREIVNDVTRIKLGCDLLVVFFSWATGEPSILRLSDDGTLELCSHFAAIGSGMYIAESSLFHREQSEITSLADAVYHVYEAMRLGSHAPGVGEKFTMGITFPGRHGQTQWDYLMPEYMQQLEKEFKKWGPRPIRSQVLHSEFMRRLTIDRPRSKRKRKK